MVLGYPVTYCNAIYILCSELNGNNGNNIMVREQFNRYHMQSIKS
jgi:hypothetical protein